jgi:hypothetical protein
MLFFFSALSFTDVAEEILSKAVEGDTLHEACWDYTVGVDVVARDEDTFTSDFFDRCGGHDF